MYRIFGTPGKLYEAFLTFDRQAAEQTQARGCACGGRLDRADYPRKPRGGPAGRADAYQRFSFCCAVEGCRRRSTPPSMRFLGRRVYLGVVVVLAAAIRSGLAPRHVQYLREATGDDLNVDRRTLARWVTCSVSCVFWPALSLTLASSSRWCLRATDVSKTSSAATISSPWAVVFAIASCSDHRPATSYAAACSISWTALATLRSCRLL